MRFSIVSDVRDYGEERLPYPTKNKQTGEMHFQGSRKLDNLEESGFRIFDNARNQVSQSFYMNESEAQKYADKLNVIRPQIILQSKKERNCNDN